MPFEHPWCSILNQLTQNRGGDFGYDYFGFKTLEKSYLLRVHGKSVERPQHLLMRASCGIHCGDLKATLETYDLMSRKFFTHATPTLFNSGTPKPQMSSCFLLKMKEDSIEGIYDTLKQCASISKSVAWQNLFRFIFLLERKIVRGDHEDNFPKLTIGIIQEILQKRVRGIRCVILLHMLGHYYLDTFFFLKTLLVKWVFPKIGVGPPNHPF